MRILPVKGTNDYLPDELAVRTNVQDTILDAYNRYGYQRISTPALEDAENLNKSEGGENLSLIYQVMKRGAKLDAAIADGAPLWDMGLRYDLTLPLARFWANNRSNLPSPFKSVQIDRAYRAERPQRGRLREFIQCDIDIIGDDSANTEIELIAVTAEALLRVGLQDFTVRVNNRALLNDVLIKFGFSAQSLPSALISLDKLDKIGAQGVCAELAEKGFPTQALETFGAFIGAESISLASLREIGIDMPELSRLEHILTEIEKTEPKGWKAVFDLSLVRGQGYYTGTVFEVELPGYPGSVAAGGRYDGMIGKFTGENIPAVGFSIGFERIVSILLERGAVPTGARKRLAALYDPDAPYSEVLLAIRPLTEEYSVTTYPAAPNEKKQLKRLRSAGFSDIRRI